MSDRPATPPPTDLTDAGTMAICSALPALELDHADEAAIARAVLAAPLVAARLAGPGQVIVDADERDDYEVLRAFLYRRFSGCWVEGEQFCMPDDHWGVFRFGLNSTETRILTSIFGARSRTPDDSVAPAGRDPHEEKG